MRIQVIKMAGGRATFSDYAARWVFRLIDIYFSLGAIASILVVSSSKAQRIGDVVANTAVVKMVPKMDLNLQDLLTIHKNNANAPQYTQTKKTMFQSPFSFEGRIRRMEYGLTILIIIVVYFILFGVMAAIGSAGAIIALLAYIPHCVVRLGTGCKKMP